MTDHDARTERCSNPKCPLPRAHSGPCAPEGWQDSRAEAWKSYYNVVAEHREKDSPFIRDMPNWVDWHRGYDAARAAVLAEVREGIEELLLEPWIYGTKEVEGIRMVWAVLDRAEGKTGADDGRS